MKFQTTFLEHSFLLILNFLTAIDSLKLEVEQGYMESFLQFHLLGIKVIA